MVAERFSCHFMGAISMMNVRFAQPACFVALVFVVWGLITREGPPAQKSEKGKRQGVVSKKIDAASGRGKKSSVGRQVGEKSRRAAESQVSVGRRTRFMRQVSFDVLNDTQELRNMPTVSGIGGLPIRLTVNDSGNWPDVRRLQVLVAIYRRPNPTRASRGDLVQTYLAPEVLTTPTGQGGSHPLETDIPLPPGNYLFYVFVCDLNEKLDIKRRQTYFPDAESFPGNIKNAKLCAARVL